MNREERTEYLRRGGTRTEVSRSVCLAMEAVRKQIRNTFDKELTWKQWDAVRAELPARPPDFVRTCLIQIIVRTEHDDVVGSEREFAFDCKLGKPWRGLPDLNDMNWEVIAVERIR